MVENHDKTRNKVITFTPTPLSHRPSTPEQFFNDFNVSLHNNDRNHLFRLYGYAVSQLQRTPRAVTDVRFAKTHSQLIGTTTRLQAHRQDNEVTNKKTQIFRSPWRFRIRIRSREKCLEHFSRRCASKQATFQRRL